MPNPRVFITAGKVFLRWRAGERGFALRRLLKGCFLLGLLITGVVGGASLPAAAGEENSLNYLKQLSLEELVGVEVTSVSRNREKLADAAAAIYVITQEDIRRGGFTTIPEALRLVPGLQVAHINANQWAISSRGGNAWFSSKLLVLMDGRQLYSPLFSGVFWDVQDTMLEDIDRIEVIRGPGAALWGSNAVNGVINIVTRRAEETQGLLFSAGAGDREKGFGALRYGGRVGERGWCRGYLKYQTRNHFDHYRELPDDDDWHAFRSGFRSDWQLAGEDRLTLQGDLYTGKSDSEAQVFDLGLMRKRVFWNNNDLAGGNLLARWHHQMSTAGELTLQFYYDRTRRDMPFNDETRDTWDIDLQHSLPETGCHQLTWGAEFRYSHNRLDDCPVVRFTPNSRDMYQLSAFAQDRISLFADRLVLTLGSKFEYDRYSGFEVQPNLRLGWTPVAGHFFWVSVSRAVRTPSQTDRDITTRIAAFKTGPTTNYLMMEGRNDFEGEKLVAYELGWRAALGPQVSLDVAAFYNDYHDLRGLVPQSPEPDWTAFPPPAHRRIPLFFDNIYDEEICGIEIAANYVPVEWWRLSCSYSRIHIDLHSDNPFPGIDVAEGNSPDFTVTLRSYLDLPGNLELDALYFYVDKLDNDYLDIPSYSRFDLRLGWHPRPELELSFKIENLFERRHPEYDMIDVVPTEVPRSFYGKLVWKF